MTLDVEKKPGSGPPIDPATAELIARSAKRTKRRLAVVGAVLVLAAGYLVFQGLGSSLNYFETVDQAVAQKASFAGKSLRLEGTVQPGTIRQIAVAECSISWVECHLARPGACRLHGRSKPPARPAPARSSLECRSNPGRD